jgi:hypothetical protein
MVSLLLAFIALAIMGMGYGFKKSWILWMDIPFWVIFFIWISFYQSPTWFPATAQHSLIFISIVPAIALGFSAVRMQLATLSDKKSTIDDVDESGVDEDFAEYLKEKESYDKEAKMFHTKTKKRRSRYLI